MNVIISLENFSPKEVRKQVLSIKKLKRFFFCQLYFKLFRCLTLNKTNPIESQESHWNVVLFNLEYGDSGFTIVVWHNSQLIQQLFETDSKRDDFVFVVSVSFYHVYHYFSFCMILANLFYSNNFLINRWENLLAQSKNLVLLNVTMLITCAVL